VSGELKYETNVMYKYLADTKEYNKKYYDRLNEILKKLSQLQDKSLYEGQVADSIIQCIEEIYKPIISELRTAFQIMNKNADSIKKSFKDKVDSNENTYLVLEDAESLKNYILATKGKANKLDQTIDEIKKVLNEMDTTIGTPFNTLSNNGDTLKNEFRDIGEYAKKIGKDVENFEKDIRKTISGGDYSFSKFTNAIDKDVEQLEFLGSKDDNGNVYLTEEDQIKNIRNVLASYSDNKDKIRSRFKIDEITKQLADNYRNEFYTVDEDGNIHLNEERIKQFAKINPEDINDYEWQIMMDLLDAIPADDDNNLNILLNLSYIFNNDPDKRTNAPNPKFVMTSSMKKLYEMYKVKVDISMEDIENPKKAGIIKNNLLKANLFYNISLKYDTITFNGEENRALKKYMVMI